VEIVNGQIVLKESSLVSENLPVVTRSLWCYCAFSTVCITARLLFEFLSCFLPIVLGAHCNR
jgi:hypothetical protein